MLAMKNQQITKEKSNKNDKEMLQETYKLVGEEQNSTLILKKISRRRPFFSHPKTLRHIYDINILSS